MASDEGGDPVPGAQVVEEELVAHLPEGIEAESVFVLAKPDNGDWSAGSAGDGHNRSEFLSQLVSCTRGLTASEAEGWFDEEDRGA